MPNRWIMGYYSGTGPTSEGVTSSCVKAVPRLFYAETAIDKAVATLVRTISASTISFIDRVDEQRTEACQMASPRIPLPGAWGSKHAISGLQELDIRSFSSPHSVGSVHNSLTHIYVYTTRYSGQHSPLLSHRLRAQK